MGGIRIYIVRHGETDANRDGTIQGQLDTELNSEGLRQVERVADALKPVPFNAAYSSDLIRASRTARLILAHHPGIDLHTHTDLRERYMGQIQGMKMKGLGLKLALSGDKTVETNKQLRKRATDWWNKHILPLVQPEAGSNDPLNVLAVSHGGWIVTLIISLIEEKQLFCAEGVVIMRCFNTSITIIEVEENLRATVVKYGDVSHLLNSRVNVVQSNVDQVEE